MKQADSVVVGKRLRELRGIRTRTGVARETGISYSTLQAYEEGKRNPSAHMKKALSSYYGVSIESIFFDE